MKVLKNIARVTSLSVGLFSFAAAQSFEGIIEMQVKSPNQETTMPMKYFVKGDFIRMEMQSPRGEMAMIMDSKNKKTIMLMPQMQSYMERNIDAPTQGDAKKSEITKTGKMEKILGYDCDQFIMKGEKGETEMWAAKGLGTFTRLGMGGPGGRMGGPGGGPGGMRGGMGGGGQTPAAWEEEFRTKGLFPMRVVSLGTDGKEESRMEVTKIEKKALDAALFKAPEGWQKMDMPMMGRPRN
jgi:hypothetical protein